MLKNSHTLGAMSAVLVGTLYLLMFDIGFLVDRAVQAGLLA